MKACEVYVRNNAIYVFSQSETALGFGISTEPWVRLDRTVSSTTLGETVLTALNASQKGVPQPSDLRAITQALLRFTGFKTWSAFARGTRLLLVAYDGKQVKVIPTAPGERGAFNHLPDQAKTCRPEADAIGQLLTKLF